MLHRTLWLFLERDPVLADHASLAVEGEAAWLFHLINLYGEPVSVLIGVEGAMTTVGKAVFELKSECAVRVQRTGACSIRGGTVTIKVAKAKVERVLVARLGDAHLSEFVIGVT